MPSAAECLAAIDKAADGKIDDDTLESLIGELDRIRQTRSAGGELGSLEDALFKRAGEIAEDVDLAATIEKRNRLINIVKEAQLLDLAQRADEMTGDPSLGLEAATVGVNAPFKGARASVDAQAQGLRNSTMGGIVHDLRKDGLLALFNSRTLDREISRELWDLSLAKPAGDATTSQNAKRIAKVLHKYRRALVQQENRAGAYIRFRQGYVTRQTHNRNLMMRGGPQKWADFLRYRLDWDGMEVPADRREDFLASAYDALVSGARKDFNGAEDSDLMFAFKGPGNLAKKESHSRTILFKSADDWFDYNETFGMRSLNEAIVADVGRASNNIALMNVFGTNPRAMFDKIKDGLALQHRSDTGKSKRMAREQLNRYMDEVDGTASIPANYSAATAGRAVRAVQSAAKLGGAVLSAVTDLAFVASERRYQGRSLLGSFGDSVAAPLSGFTSRQAKDYGDLLGVGINGVIGTTMQRFSAQDDAPGRISKAMGLFFKLNLLTPWTDGVQRGAGMMMSRELAMNADKALGALPPEMQRMLGMYGFDERKWKVAQQAIADPGDGNALMMPGEVGRASGAAFTGMSRTQQEALKDEVKTALAAMINDRVTFASPSPGARERVMTTLGTQPGSVSGEAWRFLMQFKSFPITIISKVQGRDAYGHGTRHHWLKALAKGEGDLTGLAVTIAHATVLGYFALQAKELTKGRELRTDTDAKMFTAAMLQGGGLGIYGDFLFGEASRFGGAPIDTAAGPTIGAILGRGGVVDLLHRSRGSVMDGESPDVGAGILKLLQSNAPGANLFYTKAALDYLIMYQLQEWANPGYLRRVERRMKRENNQSFLIPPSRTIPRGGGDRVFEGVRG